MSCELTNYVLFLLLNDMLRQLDIVLNSWYVQWVCQKILPLPLYGITWAIKGTIEIVLFKWQMCPPNLGNSFCKFCTLLGLCHCVICDISQQHNLCEDLKAFCVWSLSKTHPCIDSDLWILSYITLKGQFQPASFRICNQRGSGET